MGQFCLVVELYQGGFATNRATLSSVYLFPFSHFCMISTKYLNHVLWKESPGQPYLPNIISSFFFCIDVGYVEGKRVTWH